MARKKNIKDEHKAAKTYYVVAIAVILIILAISSIIYAYSHSTGRKTVGISSIPTITMSDIGLITNASHYTQVMDNNATAMPKELQAEGYLESYVSLFNLTSSSYKLSEPAIITSVLYRMSNQTAATNALEGMLFSNNENQSTNLYMYNGAKIRNYTFGGAPTKIYSTYSVALFNISPNLLNLTLPYYMPDYEYTALFSYGNFTATVLINAYYPNTTYINSSRKLAELLINKLYATHSR
jgi:hypothetical protein